MKDLKNNNKEILNKLPEITEDLLKKINSRQQNILKMRFGLENKQPKSLNAIGEKLGITRERVRQIEVDSFKKLKEAEKNENFNQLMKRSASIINFFGGVCEKRKLKEKLAGRNLTPLQRRHFMVVLNSSNRLFFQKSLKDLNAFWYIDKNLDKAKLAKNVRQLVDFIQKNNQPVSFSAIFKFALKLDDPQIKASEQGKNYVRMLLILSKDLERNILEQWGIKNWGLISGKGSREKAYLILKKYNKPFHFTELAEQINRHWKQKKALPQTVHNELIKDDNFVQVGKGTYGLSEWGILKGTVKDVIIELLKENKNGLPKEEIIDYVLSQKQVKKTTILINLTDKSIFLRDESGRIFLR